MTESTLVKGMMKNIKKEYPGCFLLKVHGGPFQILGIPDIIGCIKGRFFGIEVKLPGKEDELTKIQQKRIKQINKAGGFATMVTTKIQAVGFIKQSLRTFCK